MKAEFAALGVALGLFVCMAIAAKHVNPHSLHIESLCAIEESDGQVWDVDEDRHGDLHVTEVLLGNGDIWPVDWDVPCNWLNRKPRV